MFGHRIPITAFPGDEVGCAVAISSEATFVGACGDSRHAGVSGAGVVYRVDATSEAIDPLTAPSPSANAGFGGALAVGSVDGVAGGDVLIVGAPGDWFSTGAVYVFAGAASAGGVPTLMHKLQARAADREVEQHFGCALAMHGRRVLVGMRGPDAYPADRIGGYAYLYDLVTGSEVARYMPVDASGQVQLGCFWFGAAVALHDELVVGASAAVERPAAPTVAVAARVVGHAERHISRRRVLLQPREHVIARRH